MSNFGDRKSKIESRRSKKLRPVADPPPDLAQDLAGDETQERAGEGGVVLLPGEVDRDRGGGGGHLVPPPGRGEGQVAGGQVGDRRDGFAQAGHAAVGGWCVW